MRFTERGEAALDEVARTLTARCDGTIESITQILQQVVGAEVKDLAETLTEVAHASQLIADDAGDYSADLDVPVAEGLTAAARRRAAQNTPAPSVGATTRGHGVGR